VVVDKPVAALIDGGGGLGHYNSYTAMQLAISKARTVGVGIVGVRNSSHFGACGYYAKMAADAGFIGMVSTSASGIQVAPTGGAEAKYGTDPIAFAAPARDGEPFLLDMATTTVAAGRIRNKANEGLPTPDGWLVTKEGKPSNDPLEASQKGGFLTPLGGSAESSSYKGYGLAAMVNILAAGLSGATFPTDPSHTKKPGTMDIGHFFMAIDPSLFRDDDDFQKDVAQFCGDLRATTPIDPSKPVMVAGDPQWAYAKQRMENGIPVGPGLLQQVRQIAQASASPWLLD
jgi:LDH2 family malate/lactate/ureidoglycolate dehydrogenase